MVDHLPNDQTLCLHCRAGRDRQTVVYGKILCEAAHFLSGSNVSEIVEYRDNINAIKG